MKRAALIRFLLLFAIVVLLVLLGAYTPLGAWFDLKNVSTAIREAGIWGTLVFVILCCIGSFLQLPAMLFLLVSILVYGQWTGTLIGFVGLIVAMIVTFYFARLVGGTAIDTIRIPFVQRMLARLDDHPFRTVIMLRLVLWASPPLNFVLAMTKIRAVDYILGSLVGSIIPILVFSLLVLFFRESIIPLL